MQETRKSDRACGCRHCGAYFIAYGYSCIGHKYAFINIDSYRDMHGHEDIYRDPAASFSHAYMDPNTH